MFNKADYYASFRKTMEHEGFMQWSNIPEDAGGETYSGISRVYHPRWKGWQYLDMSKKDGKGPPVLLKADNTIMEMLVKNFYRMHFWDVNRLDEFPQALADEMFDTGVNLSLHEAAIFLQRALNALNRNERVYQDLVEDGNIGPKTLAAMRQIVNMGEEHFLITIINIYQGMHYLERMRKSHTQEKFARGWLKRVQLTKEV